MYKIITVGDALIDTHVQIDNASVECDLHHENCKLLLDFASKIPITGSFQALGGNAANVACGTAKLGLKSAILTAVGADPNGQLVTDDLKKFTVDTTLIQTDAKSQTRYSVVLNFRGERTILSYHKKRNYAWPKNMPAADWIYYTSLSEGYEGLQDKMLAWLANHPSVRLAFNPGSFQLKYSLEKVRTVLPHTEILIVNLEEAEIIANTTVEKEKSVASLIHKLLQIGVKEVVITDAAQGAWAGGAENIWQMETYPVEVVAKTGAGDAFSSGYMAARIDGHDISTAIQWGTANSCGVIQQFGAQKGLLNKNGIKKMIEKFPNVAPKKI